MASDTGKTASDQSSLGRTLAAVGQTVPSISDDSAGSTATSSGSVREDLESRWSSRSRSSDTAASGTRWRGGGGAARRLSSSSGRPSSTASGTAQAPPGSGFPLGPAGSTTERDTAEYNCLMKLILRKEEEQLRRDDERRVQQDEERRLKKVEERRREQDEQRRQQAEEQRQREPQQEIAEMKRQFLEAIGHRNSAEDKHPYPYTGEKGYGPPDPHEGFQEPYKNFGRLSPASNGGHSRASTFRFLSNVHKSLHRLKCATAVLQKGFDGQGGPN